MPTWITTMKENNPKLATTAIADDPRWARVIARDRSADGEFWYSVVTTGLLPSVMSVSDRQSK
jgi:AraC family transcriptional regulator, regulatory protein of adaptative response / methylated-DNA-[protein]-cysteine methyltransferase